MHVTVAHQQQEMLDETCLKNINHTTNAMIYISFFFYQSPVHKTSPIPKSKTQIKTEKLFISPVTHTWKTTLAKEKENIMTSSSREKS
jgi:hypothetical protein